MFVVPETSRVLLDIRKRRGLSQKEAAKRLGISAAALSYFESGTKIPSNVSCSDGEKSTQQKILELYGLPDFIFLELPVSVWNLYCKWLETEDKNSK